MMKETIPAAQAATGQKNNGKRRRKRSSKSQTLSNLFIVIAFVFGFAILFYPTVSNYVAQQNSIAATQSYNQIISDMSEDEIKEAMQAAVDYNNSLRGDPVKDPFIPGSGMALPLNYTSVLNVDDGIMCYVVVPKIDVNLPVRHGASETVLAQGLGHIEQTSLPVGGLGNHAVITGHTGLPSARLFTDLVNLELGDYFYIYVLNEKLTYQVDKISVVLPEELDQLRMEQGHDYVTLLTCTPYGINDHRLLVRGSRVPDGADMTATSATLKRSAWDFVRDILAILLLLLLIIWVSWQLWRKLHQYGTIKKDQRADKAQK